VGYELGGGDAVEQTSELPAPELRAEANFLTATPHDHQGNACVDEKLVNSTESGSIPHQSEPPLPRLPPQRGTGVFRRSGLAVL
jgi:hypothetical protein